MADKKINPLELLDKAQAVLSKTPKIAFSSTFVVRAHSQSESATPAAAVTHVRCELDHSARKAHLTINQGGPQGSGDMDIYYDGATEYIRFGSGWRKGETPLDIQEQLFGGAPYAAFTGITALRGRKFEVAGSGRSHALALISDITPAEVAAVVRASDANAAAAKFDNAKLTIEVDQATGFPDRIKVEAAGSVGIDQHHCLDVQIRPLDASFEVRIPPETAHAITTAAAQALALAPAATAACWCTGCAACAACLACAACISCLACIFPPALIPVTATAAGTAIAAAIAISTSASVGIATAIQRT